MGPQQSVHERRGVPGEAWSGVCKSGVEWVGLLREKGCGSAKEHLPSTNEAWLCSPARRRLFDWLCEQRWEGMILEGGGKRYSQHSGISCLHWKLLLDPQTL
jgi:hypothetical protein